MKNYLRFKKKWISPKNSNVNIGRHLKILNTDKKELYPKENDCRDVISIKV